MSALSTLSTQEVKRFIDDHLPLDFADKPEGQKRGICLGVLAYDARIYTRTMLCMMQAVMQCAKEGWGFTYILREADSMVARGRSILASQFLQNAGTQQCTDLVMVDTDLSWYGDEFIKLLKHPVDVCGAAYPYKDDQGNFPLRWSPDGIQETNGLWNVDAVTPGFLRVTRDALQRIADRLPWLEFKDQSNTDGQRSWMFFDNLQRPSGIYDEGYIFCEHWRQIGGRVWLDPDLLLVHTGLKAYNHGTIRQWVDKKAANFEVLQSEFPEVPPLRLQSANMAAPNIEKAREKITAEIVGPPALIVDNTKESAA